MDPYSILNISRDATSDQIKRAHRKLAQKWHPDLNSSHEAKAKFTEIQQAYESLIHGKSFKASAPPNTQPPRQPTNAPRSDPHKQQSSATQSDRLRKARAAAAKKQKAKLAADDKRERERQQYTKNLRTNRVQSEQTLTDLRRKSVQLVEQTQKSASNRLDIARSQYERLVQSINEERDKTILSAIGIRDKSIQEALRAKDERERSLVTQNATSYRVHMAEIERIKRQFQADLVATG